MSLAHILAARGERRVRSTDRHVLLVLATYANDAGAAWPSPATLAGDTGLHAGTVRKALERLVSAGVVKPGETAVGTTFSLAPWARRTRRGRVVRAVGAREITNEVPKKFARAPSRAVALEARPVDNYPNWTAERFAREEQLAMEV